MAKHARPPDDDLPVGVVEADPTPEQAARRRRGRKPAVLLPDDDPFVLIGMIDETGGIKADGKVMNHTQSKAFRALCMMPPSHRSLSRLSAKLEIEWGKSPNRKSIEKWSSEFGWMKLLKLYDEAYDRYVLWKLEQDRHEAQRRHANVGRSMIRMAAKGMTEELLEQHEVELNPRTGKPVARKGRSVQGLAFMAKVGMEMERLALGLPSTITDAKVETDNRNTSVEVSMTLDEWRRQSHLARLDPADTLSAPPDEQQLSLPAPAADKPWLKGAVSESDLDELPAEWFESGATPPAPTPPTQVVDADPSPKETPDES